MPDSIEASEQMLENWGKQIQERAEKYQAMAAKVEEISITERSRDGAVEVTISARGLLTNLVIAEFAGSRRMGELSAQIMATVQAAQSRIPELLREAMVETIGTQDQTANKLLHDAKSVFPAPPDDEVAARHSGPRELRFEVEDAAPPPPPPPRRRTRTRDDIEDDDEFGGPVLR